MKLVPLGDRVVLKPVSYTHLDVYKRQDGKYTGSRAGKFQ